MASNKREKDAAEKVKCRRLQLYNPAHKADLLKLLAGLAEFEVEAPKKSKEDDVQFRVSDDEEEADLSKASANSTEEEESKGKGGKFCCNSCSFIAEDVGDLRQHYKLDWHRYNVKRKVSGEGPVSEPKFYEMMDDLSSIEGSDSENESSAADSTAAAIGKLMGKVSRIAVDKGSEVSREKEEGMVLKGPKMYFKNDGGNVLGVYRSVAEGLKFSKNSPSDLFQNSLYVAVIMVSGGHFAAAVFRGGDVALHKTFHSYTVRAKQGGSQGSKDSKSGTSHPKSAGASLRRYNEQSFCQHIQDLMDAWKNQLENCAAIYYRAVGSSGNVLFGGKSPVFQRNDPRLRSIPFPTKRPTFAEAKKVHSFLTAVHIYENEESFLVEHIRPVKTKGSPSPKKCQINRAKSKSPKRREDPCTEVPESSSGSENEELEITQETIEFGDLKEFDCDLGRNKPAKKKTKSKKKAVESTYEKPTGPVGTMFTALHDDISELEPIIEAFRKDISDLEPSELETALRQPVDVYQSTLMHLAAQKSCLPLIWTLLDLGLDPSLKNKSGQVPYSCATSKECRDHFRKFMGQYPEKYDYKKAQIPAPLTDELEAEKAEKKKLLNKMKREKEKQKKLERKEKDRENEEQQRFLNLSDREKRALAAEQRILTQCQRNGETVPVLVRCFECACDITGKVPFEYNQNTFCTPKCLATHRRKFPTPLSV